MFRITEDPSSGSLLRCLAKNYKNNSIVSVDMDKFGVMTAYCKYNLIKYGRLVLEKNLTTKHEMLFGCLPIQ